MVDYNKVVSSVNECEALLDGMYSKIAASYGITYNALMTCYILATERDVTQKTICDQMHLAKSTVHSIVMGLVDAERLSFSPRRKGKEKILEFTPAGSAFADELMGTVRARERALLTALGPNSCRQIVALAQQVIDYLGE